MVIDIRYHLASLVGIFLALGLGILVGTSLSDAGESLERRDQWLSALEHELEGIKQERRQVSAMLEETGEERDRYRSFAVEITDMLLENRLAGRQAAVVVFGSDRTGLEEAEKVLTQAGASVVKRLHLKPEWRAQADKLLRLLTVGVDGSIRMIGNESKERGDGGDLETARRRLSQTVAKTLISSNPASELRAVESDALWFDAQDSGTPSVIVLLLRGSHQAYAGLFTQFAAVLQSGGDAHIVASIETDAETDGGWQEVLDEIELPYVNHFGSPLGKLSLVLLLQSGRGGGYGVDGDHPLWPAQLLLPAAGGDATS